MRYCRLSAAWAASAMLLVAAGQTTAAKPDSREVARQVDEALAQEVLTAGVEVAPKTSDATFLRRAWLDIVGDIPTPEHVIAFLLDPAEDKRERLV
jgi:hypothetical protein